VVNRNDANVLVVEVKLGGGGAGGRSIATNLERHRAIEPTSRDGTARGFRMGGEEAGETSVGLRVVAAEGRE